MVIRETAHADPFSPRPPARRRRAAPLAVGLSIAVHLGVGAYLINTAFHPMKLAEPPDGPTIDSRMLTREPTPPPSTRTPPPRIAPAHSRRTDPDDRRHPAAGAAARTG